MLPYACRHQLRLCSAILLLTLQPVLSLHGADNAPVSSAATKPALAEPGPLPEGTIELLAITHDYDLGIAGFSDAYFPEVFGKWWWRSIDLSAPASSRTYINDWWWKWTLGLEKSSSSIEWPITFVEPVTPWWKADGSPAPKYERNPLKPQHGGSIALHSTSYRYYFRTKTNPENATWALSGTGEKAWSFNAKLGPDEERKTPRGQLLADIVCFVVDVNWGAKSIDLTVSVASEPWESIAKVGANSTGPGISELLVYDKKGYVGEGAASIDNQSVSGNIRRNDAHWSLEMRSAGKSDGDAQVTVIHNINTGRPEKPLEWDVRVIAIDQSGKEHLPDADSFGNRTLTHAFVNATYEFRDLPLAQAKEFILQVRPFQSQKFSGVALEPKPSNTAATP